MPSRVSRLLKGGGTWVNHQDMVQAQAVLTHPPRPWCVRRPIQQTYLQYQPVPCCFTPWGVEVHGVIQLRPCIERLSVPWSHGPHPWLPSFSTCPHLSSQWALWLSLSEIHIAHLRSTVSDITAQADVRWHKAKIFMEIWHQSSGILIPSRRPGSLRGSISPSDSSAIETSEKSVYLSSISEEPFLRYTLRALTFFGVYRPLWRSTAFSIGKPSKTRLDFRTCGQWWLVQICGLQNGVPVGPFDFTHVTKQLGFSTFSWSTLLNSRNLVLFLP